ncbi:3-oxoadipate enol-lactonase [Cereibacter changlensis JA139]|uniref:3-oxoadipate enol-lactonase n=2 Tax=Cereibacter changlensis TaxID=402884 RepID=A0A2T4JQ32_9RHOB|nr:3-oxoadipate enol-lactonase [Cereibacter changlensis]PTE20039.1 3-oxoadipate enol-lactonase [Cereibacter changlensis JA139]PZX56390.1 3-oxoadipate enol-lactonase [Cereibacter changlensis]
MQVLTRPWGAMHYHCDTAAAGPTVVFATSLGTDLRLWDAVLPLLPGIRALRFDMRGHGLSDAPEPLGLSIADLAEDAAALIEVVAGGPVVFVGLSIGGMIGQVLAVERPDLLRALVLSNTAAKMGSADSWNARITAIQAGGMASVADAVIERWFAAPFRAAPELAPWRNMLIRTPVAGYAAACGAIAAADLGATTARIGQPTLVIAGAEDGASPPDLVQATAALIPGAAFHVIPGAGHLPPVETPAAFAALLIPFLKEHAR